MTKHIYIVYAHTQDCASTAVKAFEHELAASQYVSRCTQTRYDPESGQEQWSHAEVLGIECMTIARMRVETHVGTHFEGAPD